MKNLDKIAKRKLADVLLETKTLTKEQIKIAIEQTIATGKPLQDILVTSGMLMEDHIAGAISHIFSLPVLRLSQINVDQEVFSMFNPDLLSRHQFIPFGRCGSIITVLMSNILTYPIMNQIEEISQCELFLYIGMSSEIRDYLEKNLQEIEANVNPTDGMAWDTMFDLANDSIMNPKSDSTESDNPLDSWGIE